MSKTQFVQPNKGKGLSEIGIRQIVAMYREDPGHNHTHTVIHTCLTVIGFYLGDDWCAEYVRSEDNKDSFLYPSQEEQFGLSRSWRANVYNLADMLFNLWNVKGFSNCCDEFLTGHLQSAMSVLYAGMLLKQQGYAFSFRSRSMTLGKDYDIELYYSDGRPACLEVKTRYPTHAITSTELKKRLEEFRKQLPDDKPGIIFMEIPNEWLDGIDTPDPHLADFVREGARRFVGNTEAVVLVVFYVLVKEFENGQAGIISHATHEVVNEKHRFDRQKNWRLFYGPQFTDRDSNRNWTPIYTLIEDDA